MGKYGDDKAQRGFVIENVVWDQASERAKKEGVTVSAVIRAALEAYAEGDEGLKFHDALAVDVEAAAKVAEAKAMLAEAKAALAASRGASKKAAPAKATTTPAESKPTKPAALKSTARRTTAAK